MDILSVSFDCEHVLRVGWDTVGSMPYGDRLRKHRRLISQVLNSQAIVAYRDYQMANTKHLLKNLLHSPDKFDHHILRSVFAQPFSRIL